MAAKKKSTKTKAKTTKPRTSKPKTSAKTQKSNDMLHWLILAMVAVAFVMFVL